MEDQLSVSESEEGSDSDGTSPSIKNHAGGAPRMQLFVPQRSHDDPLHSFPHDSAPSPRSEVSAVRPPADTHSQPPADTHSQSQNKANGDPVAPSAPADSNSSKNQSSPPVTRSRRRRNTAVTPENEHEPCSSGPTDEPVVSQKNGRVFFFLG